MRLETIAVRAGAEIDPTTGALAPPLHLSTTFEHGPASESIHGFLYAREKNPTQLRLEAALRDLEGGLAALVFSSGMAAAAAMLHTLAAGSHVIFSDDIYIDVRNLARDFLPAWGIESSVEDLQNLEALEKRGSRKYEARLDRNTLQPPHENPGHRGHRSDRARS